MNTKRFLVALVAMLVVLSFVGVALAEDKIVTGKIERVFLKKDKSGNPFTVLIMKDSKMLEGISYKGDAPFMCFGDINDSCKSLKAGQSVKLIVNDRPKGAQVLKVM